MMKENNMKPQKLTFSKSQSWAIASALFVTLALPVQSVQALSFTFTVPNGTLNGAPNNKPVSASATFTTSGGQINLDLRNLQSGITAPNQLLTGITFLTNNPMNPADLVLSSATGTEVKLNNDGTVLSTTPNADLLQEWSLITPTSTITTLGSGQPDDMIIGPTPGNIQGNMKLAKMQTFQPFIDQLAHFVLASNSITAQTQVYKATFRFGTSMTEFNYVTCTTTNCEPPTSRDNPPQAPEPEILVLLGAGLLGMGAKARRKNA
jgi:hypothetical protein